jgi:hypothetical protein
MHGSIAYAASRAQEHIPSKSLKNALYTLAAFPAAFEVADERDETTRVASPKAA